MLVSIIIPTHNDRQWIASAIDSALAQTYSPCEVIVVDDGSTDGTEDYLKRKYGQNIRYIYKTNSGPASARNMGVVASSGKFIQFLDSDDFLTPNKIERQMTVFSANPECHVVYCDFAFTSDGTDAGIEESPADYKEKYGAENVFEALLDGNFIVIHSPLTKSDVIRGCGAFDTTLSSDEDYDLWLKIAAKGYRFFFVPEVLAFYRRRGNSVSTNLFKQSRGTVQALNKAKNYRAKLTEQERRKLKRNLSREYGWTSRHYLQQGHYAKTLCSLLRSIIHNPRHGLAVAINLMKQMIDRLLNRHVLWRLRKK